MISMTFISDEWSRNRFRMALSEEDEQDELIMMLFEHCLSHFDTGCALPNDSQKNR